MSETETPILHISGTITLKDFRNALRANGLRHFWKYTVIYLLFLLIIDLALILYSWFAGMNEEYSALGEWMDEYYNSLIRRPMLILLIIGFLLFYALYLIAIRPVQAEKRMRELHPQGIPATYDFFEDQLTLNEKSQSANAVYNLKYADIQRKIKENKYVITLSTGRKNRFGLSKAIMTAEETQSVLKLLKARCPQRRTR